MTVLQVASFLVVPFGGLAIGGIVLWLNRRNATGIGAGRQ